MARYPRWAAPLVKPKIDLENALDFAPPMEPGVYEFWSSLHIERDYTPLKNWSHLLQLIKDHTNATTPETLLARRAVGAHRGVRIVGSAHHWALEITLELMVPGRATRVHPVTATGTGLRYANDFGDPRVVALAARFWLERSVTAGLSETGSGR